jgi:hypothetical protein
VALHQPDCSMATLLQHSSHHSPAFGARSPPVSRMLER